MSITIKHNDKPNLKKCEMLCDEVLHEKLNKYDVTKFLNEHSTNLLIGKPKSGKTSLLYSLLKGPLKKVWHNVIVFQPFSSQKSMKDNIFEKLPDENKFDELTYENLESVYERLENEDKKFNNCIIFDDMGAYLKDNEVFKLFKKLVMNRRHIRTSIYFLCQTYLSVPRDIRKLFTNIFLFKCSFEENELIMKECFLTKKKYLNNIMEIVFNEPFKWLFINVDSQRLFDGFNELIFPNSF